MERYKKGDVIEGVVPVELNGKFGFIHPHVDTSWNFSRIVSFLDAVFAESATFLT